MSASLFSSLLVVLLCVLNGKKLGVFNTMQFCSIYASHDGYKRELLIG